MISRHHIFECLFCAGEKNVCTNQIHSTGTCICMAVTVKLHTCTIFNITFENICIKSYCDASISVILNACIEQKCKWRDMIFPTNVLQKPSGEVLCRRISLLFSIMITRHEDRASAILKHKHHTHEIIYRNIKLRAHILSNWIVCQNMVTLGWVYYWAICF